MSDEVTVCFRFWSVWFRWRHGTSEQSLTGSDEDPIAFLLFLRDYHTAQQKQHPRMCLIVPNINLAQNIMTLSAPGVLVWRASSSYFLHP